MAKNTKQLIVDAAIELFAQKGYSNVSIRELANHVGIKSSSLYNHFASKDAIMSEITEDYHSRVLRCLVSTDMADITERVNGKDFDQIVEEIFSPFLPEEAERLRKMSRIFLIEQFTQEKAVAFWAEHAFTNTVSRLRLILDYLQEVGKIPKVNSLLASEILVRISMTYLIQFAHNQNGEETDFSLPMKTLLSYMFERIKRGEI